MDNLGLLGLAASSFLSATLLPGNSEIVLVALLHQAPDLKWPAVVVASLGNTLGGLTSYRRRPALSAALARTGDRLAHALRSAGAAPVLGARRR